MKHYKCNKKKLKKKRYKIIEKIELCKNNMDKIIRGLKVMQEMEKKEKNEIQVSHCLAAKNGRQ